MIALPQATESESKKSGLQFRIFCFHQCSDEGKILKNARFRLKIC
jgi:hypothetical protein